MELGKRAPWPGSEFLTWIRMVRRWITMALRWLRVALKMDQNGSYMDQGCL